MSRKELLTAKEVAQAQEQGWLLEHVYDTKKRRWSICVLPTQFTPLIGANQAMAFVVKKATERDDLCVKALRAITEFNQGRT